MPMVSRVLSAVLVLALVFLAGCANTAAKRTEAGLDLNLAANGNEGFVVLKVVATRPISLLHPKWQSIEIISASGVHDEMYDVTPPYNMLMSKHVPTESLYFAKLEAGEYEITGLGSMLSSGGLLLALLTRDHANAGRKLPSFTVQAGRLANLGTIVYVPEIEDEQPEQMFLLNGPVGKQAAHGALMYESNSTGVPLVEGGGWASSAAALAEADVLAHARPLVSDLRIQHLDGGLVAGSHLGLIFTRTGPQEWKRESVDTLGRISSVSRTADGKVIAGGEYGEYFTKDSSGGWRTHRLSRERGRIAHIEPRADGSAIFVAGDLRQTRIWLVRSPGDGTAQPTEIAKLDAPPDNILVTANEIVFAGNIPGFTRETVLTRIDKQTAAVTSQNEKFWVMDWQCLPNGNIALTRMNGLSLYSSTWADNQKAWHHTDAPASVSSYWYDSRRGFSIETSAGMTMVSNQLRSTIDGGTTWTPVGTPLKTQHFSGRIVYASAEEVLLQGREMLYSTTDQGKTWKRIFPPVPKESAPLPVVH